MKTKEELEELKEEYESLNKKLTELTEDELKQVTGGREEYTIRHPDKGIDFWHSWNPNFIINSDNINTPGEI